MKIFDFDYELPEELIAQHPIENRDDSRLMVVDRKTGAITHTQFKKITDFLKPDDFLVFNNTKVLPARLLGFKEETGAKVELLLIKELSLNTWEVLARPGRKIKPDHILVFGDGLIKCRVIDRTKDNTRIVEFESSDFLKSLDSVGIVPLPPYIKETLLEPGRYQTIYAEHEGSSAAPTAGLHFTKKTFDMLHERGIPWTFVTLHVGPGTFRTVKVENIEEHKMHEEYYFAEEENLKNIERAKKEKKRIIAVGTTSTRTLESVFTDDGNILCNKGTTDIFIYPGYKFKMVDALITNFHLPRSTLLMLVSAFADIELVKKSYEEAVKEKYRFFSFGDCMMII
jgi:S-adenosylmethionine:tRNA ribosyltransferase-isomerase